jgi:SpoVK/Ycf46/Vps4 family AAA+-type ATPase
LMATNIELAQEMHPNKQAISRFNTLLGIDEHKEALVTVLGTLLAPGSLETWLTKHHADGLPFLTETPTSAPLIILSGDVGCGKTALATSVGSIVARQIDAKVAALETPSDIRGNGLVGDLGGRIVAAFEQARQSARKYPTVLIIDESDDLATSREQDQAHHEDRAGVNVVIKQMDLVGRERLPLAVIMITNREAALDPAVLRRASLSLIFTRPDRATRKAILAWMLTGTHANADDIEELTQLTESEVPYTYSDLTDRVGKFAARLAWKADTPFGATWLRKAVAQVKPTPLLP